MQEKSRIEPILTTSKTEALRWHLWQKKMDVQTKLRAYVEGCGPCPREHVHKQISEALHRWLVEECCYYRSKFKVELCEASNAFRTSYAQRFPSEANLGLPKAMGHRTGIACYVEDFTVFCLHVRGLKRGTEYPELVEDCAQILTNAIYREYGFLRVAG